ncbi:MAG: tetratricopeptide repeat protein [Sedimenticola sp.]|nr:tetratricopeptide repeat protein [Sedimenticola sp.]
MDETGYRRLVRIAIALTLAWVAWTLYDSESGSSKPGAHDLAAAGRYLEDGKFNNALAAFSEVYEQDQENIGALRGIAQSHMRLGLQQRQDAQRVGQQDGTIGTATLYRSSNTHLLKALALYDESIEREKRKGITDENRLAIGVAHANRGILKDQLEDYQGALNDYQAALKLAPEVEEGPGFLTRFMRNQPERPPSIADRARYLVAELAKPPEQRLMRLPEEDAKQRAYRLD